jgi:8-oxo-dGTP pyrophosphatase MutT (NUDIX family)
MCFQCARLRGVVPDVGWACTAFPAGIPTDIMASVHDHREPFEGDGGLTFEPKTSEDSMTLATDPPESEAQRRAMFAAKAGHSTLGIPQSVGSEYAESDPGGKLPEKVGKDLAPRKWKILKRLFGEWLDEEEAEPEHRETVDGWDAWSPESREAAAKARKTKSSGAKVSEVHSRNLNAAHEEGHKAGRQGYGISPYAEGRRGESEGEKKTRLSLHKAHEEGRERGSHVLRAMSRGADDNNWARRGRAASVAFTTEDGHVLLLRRARDETNWPDIWSFPGGQANDEETDEDCARRESVEEVGDGCSFDGLAELERVRTPNDYEHVTYTVPTKEKFEPKLSREHSDSMWAPVTRLPENTHPGVKAAIDKVIGKGDEPEEESQATDMAMDWTGTAVLSHSLPCELGFFDPNGPVPPAFDFAYDRESARQYDADGHLHVRDVNICKASVNKYLGEEIPDWEKLGLDPKKEYRLWRHPDELSRAATVKSANGKPILDNHAPIDAKNHDRDMVVGSVGTDARWEPPFVKSELTFWPAKASQEIESNKRRALSPAYRYRPDMTSGHTPDGEPYDGVMRDISFSHLAQIPEGRQGRDVIVTDAAHDGRWILLEDALRGIATA